MSKKCKNCDSACDACSYCDIKPLNLIIKNLKVRNLEKKPEPKPPASEGVREALENLIFTAEKLWNDTPKPIMSGGAINVTHPIIEEAKQTLAALPELEKRLCWRLRIDGESKHPKDCYECNGHGEVWVRKAGV